MYSENEILGDYCDKEKIIFITTEDFEYVLPAFLSAFPLHYPIEQQNFDHCFDNNFDNKTCERLLIQWLNARLVYADWITVEGTL